MITRADYLHFVDLALDGMVSIVEGLGDDLANISSGVPGTPTPYALLTHCLGVVDAWAGGFVAGRPIDRDRPSEFIATGRVDDLVQRTALVRGRLHADVRGCDPAAPLLIEPPAEWVDGGPEFSSQGAALLHVYEELAQHHGQMEIIRDVIRLNASSN